MESRYTYTVVPRIPIRNLIKGKTISRSANLSLSKDEVLMCLKHGAVYRKFYVNKPVKVTKANLDRLHRPNQLTDKEWERISKQELEQTEIEEVSTYVEEGVIPEAITEDENPVEVVEETEEVLEEESIEESTEEIVEEPEEVEIKKEVEEQLTSGDEEVTVVEEKEKEENTAVVEEVAEEVMPAPTLVEENTVSISIDSLPEVTPIEEAVPEVKPTSSRSRSRKKKKAVDNTVTE